MQLSEQKAKKISDAKEKTTLEQKAKKAKNRKSSRRR
jgi:hypothetical protein